MNAIRSVVLKLSFLLVLSPGLAKAETTVPSDLESNYVLSPKGCTGLSANPDQDYLFVALSFDQVLQLDGDKIVAGSPDQILFVVVPCRMKTTLEECVSRRGVFKLNMGTGLFSFPQSSQFTCAPKK